MRVRILKDGSIVNTVDIKKEKHDNEFVVLHKIEAMQATEDVLKMGRTGHVNLGIDCLQHKEGVWQKSKDNKGKFRFDGKQEDVRLDLKMYETGFILKTGISGSNLLGMTFESYLSRFGRTKIYTCPKDSAKVFASLKTLKTFIEKNRRTFEYLVKRYGYEWSFEDANPLSAEDYSESLSAMTSKKREKEEALREDVTVLLAEINASEDEDRMPENIPDEVTPEVLKEEALRRMRLLDMWENVVNDFDSNGTVYMSETAGIVYDLNNDAKKAVKKVTDDGMLAYAVIRQNTTFGEVYTVLYVSTRTDEWIYEIPTNKGWLMSYVYNASCDDMSEYGSVQVKQVSGGLVRVE